MSLKVDPRFPAHLGRGLYPECPVIKTAWDKAMSYKDAMHYVAR